jgi:hypothetical protein
MSGPRAYEVLGVSVSRAGDWNLDGIEDIAAGAPGSTNLSGGEKCGVYIFSGADGSVLRFFDGADYSQETAGFGYAMASGKDVNGDGYPDLLVGAPAWTDESSIHSRQGAVYLISGRSGAVLWQYHGADENDYNLGQLVYMIEDHDGDGMDQWVVSDPHYRPPGGLGGGRITIYQGAIGDLHYGCPTTPNSVGPGARLFAVGPISLRDNLLQLSVEGAPPSAFGVFVYGTPSSPTPFGDGVLCAGGSLFVAGYLATGPGGSGLLPLDLFHPPFSRGPGAVHPGDSRAFQYLYRDPGAGARNTSDSMVIRFVP